jgi:peptidoglycan hydrolase-like protein with peptidoglycan-binding domain
MKKTFYAIIVSLLLSFGIFAQDTTAPKTAPTPAMVKTAKPKKPTFRSTKDQVMQAQKMLKLTETGKNNPETKTAIKKYQADNGLKTSGSLNRMTLEKMGIELTDKQKGMPMMPTEMEKPAMDSTGKAPRKAPFRASKDQIMMVQKMLKVEETGKLNDTTREAIKKYQDSNAVKVTGTLNKETLTKMGVELTDKQKDY